VINDSETLIALLHCSRAVAHVYISLYPTHRITVDRAVGRVIGLATTVAQRHNAGMIRDKIRELLDRDPFAVFRLVLSSGRHYDVVDPQMTVLLKSEIFVAFPDGERSSLIPLLHVTSVETLPDGRGRRTPGPRHR
jgi:hypothetical protein